MEIQTRRKSPAIVSAVISGIVTLIATILTIIFGSQVQQFQNQAQQINVNVINTLGQSTASEMKISESSNIEDTTRELTQAYLDLQQESAELKKQVDSLTDFILEKYPSSEVDQLIKGGYIKETPPVRLDNLEALDGEFYDEVPTVKDLYGTTHSVSYKMRAIYSDVAWVKFKLDKQYDKFTANIVTTEDTNRDSNMSVEVYVDGNLVSREDDIVRSENIRPIGANVSDGNVLMIKVIGSSNIYGNICYISDAELTQLK